MSHTESAVKINKSSLLFSAVKILGGSALLALSAHFGIMLPFSPIPITGQTLVLILLSLSFGRKDASAMVLAYLIEGLSGLPVFANVSGITVLFSPTFGYLISFLAAAYIIGFFADKACLKSTAWTALAVFLGQTVIYLFGMAWLAFFVPIDKLLALGFFPFVMGDLIKGAAAILLFPALRKAFNK